MGGPVARAADPPTAATCAQGDALAAAGQKEKAEETYVKVIEAEPGSKCAPAGLAKVEGKPDLWERIGTAGKRIGSALAFLALVGLVFLLLVQIVVQFLTRIPWVKDHRPVRRLVRSGLEVKSMDDAWMTQKMGAQVASLVRGRITPKRRGGAHLVTGYAALSDTLKPLSDISSEAKTAVSIASLLSAMRRRQNFEVGGALQPKGKSGLGVSIELTREKSYLAFSTLWEKEFATAGGEVEGFQQLAVPVAGWIDHHINTAMGAGKNLLSKDPKSWALFKAGAAWQEQHEKTKARALYEAALNIDPGNIGALANLGVMELSGRKYPESEELLLAALDELSSGSR
jgi:tetratricopeptide (TPR) repeat protein